MKLITINKKVERDKKKELPMFIVHAPKKFYALLVCTLFMVQPLQAISFDIPNKNIIFPLLFISACALLGMLTSHLRKIDALTKNIPAEKKEKISLFTETTKKPIRKLPNRITTCHSYSQNLWIHLPKKLKPSKNSVMN